MSCIDDAKEKSPNRLGVHLQFLGDEPNVIRDLFDVRAVWLSRYSVARVRRKMSSSSRSTMARVFLSTSCSSQFGPPLCSLVSFAKRQQIAQSRPEFDRIDRLVEKVRRARFDGGVTHAEVHRAGDHDDGNADGRSAFAHRRDELDAIHAVELVGEEHDIEFVLGNVVERLRADS